MKKRYKIREDLLRLINSGTYAPGDKLPSIRSVADTYRCSITPVVEAYNDLLDTNIIESRPCSGYYVSSDPVNHPELQKHSLLHTMKSERFEMLNSVIDGYSVNSVNADNEIAFPFGPTAAHSSYYPIWDIIMAIGSALKYIPPENQNYQIKVHDNIELKYEIMKWMMPAVSTVQIDELSVVNSVSTALLLSMRACCSAGETVALESPGFTGFYFIAQFLGLRVMSIPSDPVDGFDVDYFERQLSLGVKPSCVVLSSCFCNPTGAVMHDIEKLRLVKLCSENDIPIIEDDILGETSFSDERPRPLKAFDAGNVIYISGFGKTLSPEHRLAWMAPGKYADKIAFYKHLIVSYPNPSIQAGFAWYLKNENAAGSLIKLRKTAKKIMTEQIDILNSCFPLEHPMTLPGGGIYLWVPLKKEIDSAVLSKHCIPESISITPAVTFNAPEGMKNCFRINCLSMPWDENSKNSLVRLGRIATSIHDNVTRK